MLSDEIANTTLTTTRMTGKAFMNAVRGAVMFGALAAGAVMLASIGLGLCGVTLFGLGGIGIGAGVCAMWTPMLGAAQLGAMAGAAVQFVTSFIPAGDKSPPTRSRSAVRPVCPPYRSPSQDICQMPDINPDARQNHVEALARSPAPMRDSDYDFDHAGAVEASRNAPQAGNTR